MSTKTDTGKKNNRFYYLSIEKCLDPDEDRLDAVLSIPSDRKIKENFDRDVILDLSDRDKEFEQKQFPLNIIYGKDLMTWIMGYWNFYKNDDAAIEQFKKFKEEVLDVITSYKLPVITLDKETPREAVCKVFENVNTGGVPLTVFELVTASFATQDFDLREDWKTCKSIIRGVGEPLHTDVFDGIDETIFLTTVALYTSYQDKLSGKSGSVSCKKKDVLALKFESYQQNKNFVLNGFKLARKFLLQYQCVFRQRDLPYSTQMVPLAAICAVLGESRSGDPNVIEILSRWYWCGILGEMYGSANETRYANDIEDVLDEINGKANPSRTINGAFFSSVRLLTLQTRNSAAYKGIMALIYKEKCRDFMNDITIDVINSMVESPDIHHIFPEDYCIRQGLPKEKFNSIINKTPMLPKTNRAIGGHAPSIYLDKILKSVKGLSTDELRARVESHLVSYDFLAADNFDSYFIDRAKKLLDVIGKAMGKPVSDRAAENTVKQFGLSLE